MLIKGLNWRITGCEARTSKYTGKEYLAVKVEDEAGSYDTLVDWDLEHATSYKQGKRADFVLNMKHSKEFFSMTVLNHELKD